MPRMTNKNKGMRLKKAITNICCQPKAVALAEKIAQFFDEIKIDLRAALFLSKIWNLNTGLGLKKY